MDESRDKQPDIREYLAAERTFLAYIRTGLALMAFGFVVARFSLFLSEIRLALPERPSVSTPGLSVWFGIAFVVFGVALNVVSVFEYRALIRRLNSAHAADWPAAATPIATALFVALCGAVMAAYLHWLR
jgi:putative membrane protein